jgi:hypothetical protein
LGNVNLFRQLVLDGRRLGSDESQAMSATITAMRARWTWMLAVCAVAGAFAGFVALAIAAANEPALPAALIAAFSPGLRLAELVMPPARHESLGWTFGWFLRIAIAGNALFYFVLFGVISYAVERGLRKPVNR